MRAIFAAVLTLLTSVAYAQELTVICRYERTMDDTGKEFSNNWGVLAVVTFMLPIGRPKTCISERPRRPAMTSSVTGMR